MIVSVSFSPPPRHTAVLDAVHRGAHLSISERTPIRSAGRLPSVFVAASVQACWPPLFRISALAQIPCSDFVL